jgi:hypothetical protein
MPGWLQTVLRVLATAVASWYGTPPRYPDPHDHHRHEREHGDRRHDRDDG